jgi:hypothetical protein
MADAWNKCQEGVFFLVQFSNVLTGDHGSRLDDVELMGRLEQ